MPQFGQRGDESSKVIPESAKRFNVSLVAHWPLVQYCMASVDAHGEFFGRMMCLKYSIALHIKKKIFNLTKMPVFLSS